MPSTVRQLASRLTFRQLQVFKYVYELKSYSRAGDQLGLSQPAVSNQIRQLEQILERPLFEYIGRQLYTTVTANHLAQCTLAIFTELQQLQNNLAAQLDDVSGELRLVAVTTAQYVLPYLLKAYTSLHPEVSVSIKVVNRTEAIARFGKHQDELTIMGITPLDLSIVSMPFLDNELIAVAPKDHPILSVSNPSLPLFLKQNLLLREEGSGCRLALELHCQKQRIHLQPQMEIGSNDTIKHAVIAGLGVAVLPRLGILAELASGALKQVSIKDFPLRRSFCVVHAKDQPPTPAMRSFIDYIQQNIGQFEHMFAHANHAV